MRNHNDITTFSAASALQPIQQSQQQLAQNIYRKKPNLTPHLIIPCK
jgi:hypothetical protein